MYYVRVAVIPLLKLRKHTSNFSNSCDHLRKDIWFGAGCRTTFTSLWVAPISVPVAGLLLD